MNGRQMSGAWVARVLRVACFAWVSVAHAQTVSQDAAVVLARTGSRGGLCLAIGAKDPAVATALASQSTLYVQVLQPDAQVAAQWGAVVVNATNRERLGIRNAVFDPDQYDSDLFNLIVVEDLAGLAKARLADLNRMLVPNGCVAFKNVPAGLAAEAKTLKMDSLSAPLRQGDAGRAGSFQVIFRKPVVPFAWKPGTLKVKWSAGPLAHEVSCYGGFASGSGKFFYRERMEVEGGLKVRRSQLFARDVYNGRLLWSLEEPLGSDINMGAAADNRGRLFTCTSEGKLVCLDAETGKLLFVLLERGAGGGIGLHDNDKYVVACGRVFSAEDGKLLWTLPPAPGLGLPDCSILPYSAYRVGSLSVQGDSAYVCDAKTLKIMKLADGKIREFTLEGIPDPKCYGGIVVSGKHLLIGTGNNLTSVDRTSGKTLWTWTANWPQTFSTNLGPLSTLSVGGRERLENEWGYPLSIPDGDKLVIMRRKGGRDIFLTRLDLVTGKLEKEGYVPVGYNQSVSACAPCRFNLDDYIIDKERWIDKKTLEGTDVSGQRKGLPPGLPVNLPCFIGAVLAKDAGLFLSMPSRKSGYIVAFGPSDSTLTNATGLGWKNLQKFGQPGSVEPTKDGDWPMFRSSAAMGNFIRAAPGDKPVKIWEATLGLGGRSYGVMNGERTGLTQPVSAYGLVVVADIDGQRVVAVSAADGKQKWAFHVGSRVDYSPALYKGLCLFSAKDGWVYCLDANTGVLIWKNRVPGAERYTGARDKLEAGSGSVVLVEDGVGTVDGLAFKPETGELASAPKHESGSRRLAGSVGGVLEIGNSLPRNTAEKGYPKLQDGRAVGKMLAFDDTLSVAYTIVQAERWDLPLNLVGVDKDMKKPLWTVPNIELVVDDIVLTPQYAYCVGHYQRIRKNPELWVISREDGKVVNTVSVDGFPAVMGMSAAGNKLFVATREGKLICYRGAK